MLTLVLGDSYDDLIPEFRERVGARPEGMTPLEQVMAPEWVVTPSLGVRTWLVAQVAVTVGAQAGRTDGIVANWEHDFPSGVTSRVLAHHLEAQYSTSLDPWQLPQLQFALYDWASRGDPDADIRLVSDRDGRPSLARCRQLADLLDRYFTWRPEMIRSWSEGGATDSAEEEAQGSLFRAVRAHLAVPSPPERWDEAWGLFDSGNVKVPSLHRISLFGLSSFPGGLHYVDALQRLARVVEVTLYLVRPLADGVSTATTSTSSFETVGLQSWGGAALSLAHVIDELMKRDIAVVQTPQRGTTGTAPTRLRSLQSALRTDVRQSVLETDTSIVVHECHGESRQAEVLRDAIVHELQEKAQGHVPLHETDVLVVCPNITAFEPLLRTAFGARRMGATTEPQPALAYRIIDRSISSDGQLLLTTRHLLSLMRSRCTRSDVLGFMEEPLVQRTRGITGEASELYSQWTKAAGVRWGLNEDHRSNFKIEALGGNNTWESGLRRLTMGAFIENPRLRASKNLLPVEVAPHHFDELATLVALIAELTAAVSETVKPQTLHQWLAWYDKWTRAIVAPGPDDTREAERVLRALTPLRDAANVATATVSFADFQALLDEVFESLGSTGALLTGGVTVTSPDTLRGVSFRSVYIVGFDENAFTAAEWERSDLRRQHNMIGDVTPSDDARGRLREVLLSAGERVTILRTGTDVTNNQLVDPGVAFSELLDALDDCEGVEESPPPVMTIRHPRNSFSPSNFDPVDGDAFGEARQRGLIAGPWSFSRSDFELVEPATRQQWRDFYESPRPTPVLPSQLMLRDLEQFFKNPSKTFVSRVLGISLPDSDEEEADDLDAEIDRRLIASVVGQLWEEDRAYADAPPDGALPQVLDAMEASGDIPPEALMERGPLLAVARGLAEGYRDGVQRGVRRHVVANVDVKGTTLSADFDVIVDDDGTTLVEVMTSKLSVARIIPVWLRMVTLRATIEGPLTLHLVYRPENTELHGVTPVRRLGIDVSPDEARAALAQVLELFEANLKSPLPFAVGEKTDFYAKPILTDAKWTYSEFTPNYYAKYLGDPYWKLALGHRSADDIRGETGPYAYRENYATVRRLLDSVGNLYSFVVTDGALADG